MNNLLSKEKEVELSRLKHSILEKELKLLKKLEEVQRIETELTNAKKRLEEKNKG